MNTCIISRRKYKQSGTIMTRTLLATILGAFALMLTACGGGGGGGNTAPAQPKSVLIEEYGDSTTLGVEIFPTGGIVTPNSEPVDLQATLRAQFGATVTVNNQGVSGIEASQLLNGTDGVHPSWINQMASSKAQIVTINLTLNSPYYAAVPRDGIPAESPSQYGQVMTQLVQIAKAAGKQVILYEPNPVCEPIRQPVLGSYVTVLRQVAQAQGIPLVAQYDYIQTLPNWQSLLSDCLHPTDALYKIKADRETAIIAPLVQTLMN